MESGVKFIVRRIRMRFADGTHSNVNTRKEVFNVDSYREYLMAQHGAERVEFVYETIPVDNCKKLKVRIA